MCQLSCFLLTNVRIFAHMKRGIIWTICIIVAISFMALLYLQARYASEMVKMRMEQFDENVFRSLDQASRDMERSETFKYLQTVLNQHELDAYYDSQFADSMAMSGRVQLKKFGKPMLQMGNHSTQLSNSLTLHQPSRLSQSMNQLQKRVQQAYVYERDILDEVIYAVMYTASDLSFQDRISTAELDNYLRAALERNGISLPFHFVVYTADGREIYRCEDYDEYGVEYSYTQTLFRSDPTGQMGVVCVHFPDRKPYLLSTANYVLPAMVFTIILLITFVVTVYFIVRQKKVNEMKNDFVHNMTHEFKTPLSTISIAAQMLADKSIQKSQETYERLGRTINDETRRLRFQVEKVLQMSLFDRNNIALKLQELDANDLIENVVETFSLKVTQSGGVLNTKIEAFNPFVNVDEMHFTNVLFNLLDNAVKYRRDDTPLNLEVATWNQGEDYLCISIADNGVGIPKDDLKRIFDRFYRVHTGNKHDVKGFGLGLTYVKKMIDLHHGSIKAVSEVGNGTKFTIILPIVKD